MSWWIFAFHRGGIGCYLCLGNIFPQGGLEAKARACSTTTEEEQITVFIPALNPTPTTTNPLSESTAY